MPGHLSGLAAYARAAESHGEPPPWTIAGDGNSLRLILCEPGSARTANTWSLLRCGAAIANLQVALHHFGRSGRTTLLPEGEDSPTVAEIRFDDPCPGCPEEDILFLQVIPEPSGPESAPDRWVSPAAFELLRHAARCAGAWLEPVVWPGDPLLLPFEAILGATGTGRADWIRAGEALQRARLHASLHGLTVSANPLDESTGRPARPPEQTRTWPIGPRVTVWIDRVRCAEPGTGSVARAD